MVKGNKINKASLDKTGINALQTEVELWGIARQQREKWIVPKSGGDEVWGQDRGQGQAGHGHVNQVHGQDELLGRQLAVLVDVRQVPIEKQREGERERRDVLLPAMHFLSCD